MKIIFLDVDGVLNHQQTSARCGVFIGIDKHLVKNLRKIVDATDAKIVLTSSWKSSWFRVNKEDQDRCANYLDQHLRDEGLFILDKTYDRHGSSARGDGIKQWLNRLSPNSIENFVILDDEVFDYRAEGLLPNLVQTSFYIDNGGLTENHVNFAIKILNEGPSASQPLPTGFVPCSKCLSFEDCEYKESRDGCSHGIYQEEE